MPAEADLVSGMGRSWQSTLSVNSRQEAEARLSELEYSWEWMEQDELRVTSPTLPAVRELGKGAASSTSSSPLSKGGRIPGNDPSKSILMAMALLSILRKSNGSPELADGITFDLPWQGGDLSARGQLPVHARTPVLPRNPQGSRFLRGGISFGFDPTSQKPFFLGNDSVSHVITIRKLDLSGFQFLPFLHSPVPSLISNTFTTFFYHEQNLLSFDHLGWPLPVLHAEEKKRMPNLIILLADDLGYGELGCQGNKEIPTPHIDGIAKKGVRFTQGYVTAPKLQSLRGGSDNGKIRNRFGHEFNHRGAKNENRLGSPIRKDPCLIPSRWQDT